MNKTLKILLISLSVIYGAIYIYSAYTKAFPIQSFEYTLVEFLHMPWWLAALASRFFIGLELGLGVLTAISLYGNSKWVLKLSMYLLIIFSTYLIYLWAAFGNAVNCGCFGDSILMSPSASLIKNAVLLIITWFLYRFNDGIRFDKAQLAGMGILVAGIAATYFWLYIPSNEPNWLRKDKYMLDLSALYTKDHELVAEDLMKGKHVVAFLSAHCPHCKIAAYKMHLMKQHNPNLPFFLIIGGTTSDLTEFWSSTQAKDIPHTRLEKNDFLRATGGVFPYIVWVNDSKVEAKAEYINLSQQAIEKWLAE